MTTPSTSPRGSTIPATGRTPDTGRYTVKMGAEVIGKAHLSKVSVDVIKTDTAYQRDTNAEWVEKHRPYNAQQAGALVLSARAGGPYVIDGGHRLALARRSSETHVNAFIIEGLTQRDEARLFTRYQRERRNLSAWAMWRADLLAGDSEVVDIDRIVRSHGLAVMDAPGEGHIQAIASIRHVYSVWSGRILDRTLGIIRSHWYGEDMAFTGQVIRGLAQFLMLTEGDKALTEERLDHVLSRLAPTRLIRLAMAVADRRKTARVTYATIAEALREQYNLGSKNKLAPFDPTTNRGTHGRWAKK